MRSSHVKAGITPALMAGIVCLWSISINGIYSLGFVLAVQSYLISSEVLRINNGVEYHLHFIYRCTVLFCALYHSLGEQSIFIHFFNGTNTRWLASSNVSNAFLHSFQDYVEGHCWFGHILFVYGFLFVPYKYLDCIRRPSFVTISDSRSTRKYILQ